MHTAPAWWLLKVIISEITGFLAFVFHWIKLPSCPQQMCFLPLLTGSTGLNVVLSHHPPADSYTEIFHQPYCDSSICGSAFMLLGYDRLQTCYSWLWRWFGSRNAVDSSKKTQQMYHTLFSHTRFLCGFERDMAGIAEEEQHRVRISKLLWAFHLVWEFASYELHQRCWRGKFVCAHVCVSVQTHHFAQSVTAAALDIHMAATTVHLPVTMKSQFQASGVWGQVRSYRQFWGKYYSEHRLTSSVKGSLFYYIINRAPLLTHHFGFFPLYVNETTELFWLELVVHP